MKNALRFLVGGLLLSASLALAVPDQAAAWSTLGGSLSLSQRDARIYDNFTDAQAHDNNTPHANWPGYIQIELADWKALAEWGSRPFGDGTGDPLQSTVGDGGGNFAFFFEGEANTIGTTNDNICSEIPGSSGGVLAYTEIPISDGWRIRYYAVWTWQDGPGSVTSGIDYQGVASHEHGHALGLGHSTVSGATMYASISGTGTSARSIETDDKNGLQIGIYGTLDTGVVPWIDTVSGNTGAGGTVVVVGGNFDTANNTVWLNSTGTNGVPYKITGVSSTGGGTQITFTMPSSGVESGGIHIQRNRTDHKALSEGHPYNYGGVPTDTILLVGPNVGFGGSNVTYDWSNAPASSPWWFYRSFTDTGTTINGQPFDIGTPYWTVATGTTTASGTGTLTGRIPNRAVGWVLFLEVRVDDAFGVTYDSNMIELWIY